MNAVERANLALSVVADIAVNIEGRERSKQDKGRCAGSWPEGQSKEQIKSDIRYARRLLLMLWRDIDRERVW